MNPQSSNSEGGQTTDHSHLCAAAQLGVGSLPTPSLGLFFYKNKSKNNTLERPAEYLAPSRQLMLAALSPVVAFHTTLGSITWDGYSNWPAPSIALILRYILNHVYNLLIYAWICAYGGVVAHRGQKRALGPWIWSYRLLRAAR